MSSRILQINFKYSVSGDDYKQAVAPLAADIAAVTGLRWKVWIINEADSEAGGIYLFDDEASVQAYLEGPIVAGVVSNPVLSDFSVKQFEAMEDVSVITRGPISEATPA